MRFRYVHTINMHVINSVHKDLQILFVYARTKAEIENAVGRILTFRLTRQ